MFFYETNPRFWTQKFRIWQVPSINDPACFLNWNLRCLFSVYLTQIYNRHLTNLPFSIHTASYGTSFFSVPTYGPRAESSSYGSNINPPSEKNTRSLTPVRTSKKISQNFCFKVCNWIEKDIRMIVFTIGMKDVYLGVTNSPNNLRLYSHYFSFATRKLYKMGLCSFLRTVFCKRDFCNGAKLRRRSDRKMKCLISDSSFCATLSCSVNCEDWSQLRRKWIFTSEDWDLVRLVHFYAVAVHTTTPGGFSCPHGCYPLSGGEYFRTFWVGMWGCGMCRWDPGTLSLYQI